MDCKTCKEDPAEKRATKPRAGQQSVFVEDIAFEVYMEKLHLEDVNAVYHAMLVDKALKEQFTQDVQKIKALSTGYHVTPEEAETLRKAII